MNLIERIPKDVVQNSILPAANNPHLAEVNNSIRGIVDAQIEKIWKGLPHASPQPIEIHLWIHKRGLPKNIKTLGSLYRHLIETAGKLGIPVAVAELRFTGVYFTPAKLIALDDAIQKRRGDEALVKLWPELAKALGSVGHPVQNMPEGVEAIKKYIGDHQEDFAQITELTLGAGFLFNHIKAFPEEISSLKFPNLVKLDLYEVFSGCIPLGFGRSWKKLKELNIYQASSISCLPNDFGNQWPQLERLLLRGTRITQLPPGFCTKCPKLKVFDVDASFGITPHKIPLELRKITKGARCNQLAAPLFAIGFITFLLYLVLSDPLKGSVGPFNRV